MLSAFFFQFEVLIIIASLIVIIGLSVFLFRKESGKKPKEKKQKKSLPTLNSIEQMEALNEDLKPAGFAYEVRQDMFFSLMECWQREFGYCKLYDDMAPTFSMIIDSEPITFDYNGKKWLIELWKGQYGMTTGAEIGVYNTTEDELQVPGLFEGTLYHSVDDSERLFMSYSLRKDNEVLFTRNDLHWWLTGFKLGMFSEPSELTLDIRITFPNGGMCNAFVEALYKVGYSSEEVLVRYHSVFFVFDKPHSEQPESRSNLTEYLVQKSNKLYCETYEYITRDYQTTLDKLQYLKIYSPKMFSTVMNMGSDKELFRHFNVLKSYEGKRG